MERPLTAHDDMERRIAALEDEARQLRRLLGEQRASEAGDGGTPRPQAVAAPSQRQTGPTSTVATVRDRRSMLKGLGVAAAAGTAAAIGTATPAAAGDGDFLEVGATVVQDVAATTELRYAPQSAPPGGNVLTVQNGVFDSSEYPAAIGGYAVGGGIDVGVYAYSQGGTAFVASAPGGPAAMFWGGDNVGSIRITPHGPAPTAATFTGVVGDILLDATAQLWLCVAAGNPGTWRLLARSSSVTALSLHDAPIRAYDSRPTDPPLTVTKGKLSAGQSRDIDLKVADGVPDGAIAALLNVTCTGTSSGGFLQIYKTGAPAPTSSSINWDHVGTNVANSVTVALDGSERCTVKCGGTNAQTDVIIDVVGYYL